jgi:predicted phage terminase large subunit-like protein
MAELEVIGPQPGPQTMFLETSADIAIYGGAAGGGKSFGLQLEPLRHATTVRGFEAVMFRRTLADAKKPGSTWDQTMKMYPLTGGNPVESRLQWEWPGGGRVTINHLEHDKTVLDWQSAEIPLMLWDELTHFSKAQFFYMLSRNRSTIGIKPYVRASCNPDADSWVKEFIAWWLNDDGYPIQERSGKIRWFIRLGDNLVWANSVQELLDEYGTGDPNTEIAPKSVTFIGAKLTDNPALMQADPGYRANLMALSRVERERLLGGNWKIRPAAGLLFNRAWCPIVDAAPAGPDWDWVRYWDLAATEKTELNDPDWTVGVLLGRNRVTKRLCVAHVERMQKSPLKVKTAIQTLGTHDGHKVRIGVPQDPAQAGKAQAKDMVASLEGYDAHASIESGDKVTRFLPFSAQAEAGNIDVVRGAWNDAYFAALEGFPDSKHKDDADASSGAYEMYLNSTFGILDYYRAEAERIKAEQEANQ